MKIEIKGIPYGKYKVRGNKNAPKEWEKAIVDQSKDVKAVNYPCILRVEFLLPPDKYPKDFPYGPDLDNMLKLLLDALQKTFLSNDSLIVKLIASKKKVTKESAGVNILIKQAKDIQANK